MLRRSETLYLREGTLGGGVSRLAGGGRVYPHGMGIEKPDGWDVEDTAQ